MRIFKIDVSRHVADMEYVLRSQDNPSRCREAVAILERWQFDEMLDDASREKAKLLLREFQSKEWFFGTLKSRNQTVSRLRTDRAA